MFWNILLLEKDKLFNRYMFWIELAILTPMIVIVDLGLYLISLGLSHQATTALSKSFTWPFGLISGVGLAGSHAIGRDKNGYSIIAAPIVNEQHQVVGALLENNGTTTANPGTFAANNKAFIITILFLLSVLILSLPLIFLAAIIGTLFGFLTARTFTRRIKRLFSVADNWSRGDFSASINDTSSDELGQLAQRLNTMAQQLQNLLNTRQKLASLEERNRLARDLHDSVKQQVFAVSMQVRTAKMLLKSNTDEAHEHLQEAEQLVQKTQQELIILVRELRPIALENKAHEMRNEVIASGRRKQQRLIESSEKRSEGEGED